MSDDASDTLTIKSHLDWSWKIKEESELCTPPISNSYKTFDDHEFVSVDILDCSLEKNEPIKTCPSLITYKIPNISDCKEESKPKSLNINKSKNGKQLCPQCSLL